MEENKKQMILDFLEKIKTPAITISMTIDNEEMKATLRVDNLQRLIKEFDVNPLDYITNALLDEFVIRELPKEDRMNYESKSKIS